LDEKSNALAHLLRRGGVRAGDSLVILLPNDLAWPIAVAAGMRTGLAVTPINWHVRTTELTPMLAESQPAAIITNLELTPPARAATATIGCGRWTMMVDGALSRPVILHTTLEGLPTTPVEDDLLGAQVLFSGGTTGRPTAYRQPPPGILPLEAPPRHPALGEQ